MLSASPSSISTLSRYGWDDAWEQLALAHDGPGRLPGRVARVDRGRVDVLTDSGRVRARCPVPPAVGDWVLVDPWQ